jgi:hypothetical protein
MIHIEHIPTYLGWTFTHILPGTFKRNRAEFKHHDYPILAPLPPKGTQQTPMQGEAVQGPFIYFIVDDQRRVFYVGKSKEAHVLKRWIRPGNGGPAKHYWTHSTSSGGCVFNIAEGLRAEKGPYHLRFVPFTTLRTQFGRMFGLDDAQDIDTALTCAERGLIRALSPLWNHSRETGGPG